MLPEDGIQRRSDLMDDGMHKGLERSLSVAGIAAAGCSFPGAYPMEGRVVVSHPDRDDLPFPLNLLCVERTAKAPHVAIPLRRCVLRYGRRHQTTRTIFGCCSSSRNTCSRRGWVIWA
jgi:hypothetical protein